MDSLIKIGLEAKQRRKQMRLSQSDVAEKIQAHRNDISRIENGKYTGSIITVAKYLELLGFTLSISQATRPTLDELPGIFGIEDD